MMTATHPYFADKARTALAKAGGDPDKAGPLAEWAEGAKSSGDTTRGVIVAEDGSLVAETTRNRLAGATYVTDADTKRLGLRYQEIGMAMGEVSRLIGQRVIHVTFSEVCIGPGSKGGRPEVGPPITIKVPPALLARVDAAAQAAGLTRAEWVRRAAEAALAPH